MEKLLITGGKPLKGTVAISGAKNAVVAIIPAALLVKGVCRIENVPDISDVDIIVKMISSLGAKVQKEGSNTLIIDSSDLKTYVADPVLAAKMRASYYLMGALIGRFGNAHVPPPGGCNFGSRPIDQHIKAFKHLNCLVAEDDVFVKIDASSLKGGNIYFDMVSVGATINAILAAVMAPGKTVLENAAREPHVVDLANFLNSMGAQIRGAGTNVIKITGVSELKGGTYSIIPDQIEAGTYMFAAAATRGDVVVKNVIPKHLDAITAKFSEMGFGVEEGDEYVRIYSKGPISSINIKTMPYPGFPTDLQPQAVAMLATVNGKSVVTEGVWETRFQYVEELVKFNAKVTIDGEKAIIDGGAPFESAKVTATDLRAGASMVIAALACSGTSEVSELRHIDRGYEHMVEKLVSLGADIQRVDD